MGANLSTQIFRKYIIYIMLLYIFQRRERTFRNLMPFCLGGNMPIVVSSIRRFSKGRDKQGLKKKIVILAEQSALGVDMCGVEEITDSRVEELTDKERIHFEET